MGKKVGLYGTGGVIWNGCEYMYMDIMRQWGCMGQALQIKNVLKKNVLIFMIF